MYGWTGNKQKLKPESITNGSAVYEIGTYSVTVDPDGTVSAEHLYRTYDDPRRTMPNMEIRDGEIRIPITDIVAEVLNRLEPADLAKQLWSDEDVRRLFAKEVVKRWNSDWTDQERRSLLRGLRAEVHSKALESLADQLSGMEWYNSQRFYHNSHVNYVNRWLSDHGFELRMPYEPESQDFKVGGNAWNEARDYWRRRVEASFPLPPEVPDALSDVSSADQECE